ncbi:MAG TPA: methyltransferase domain-containing protein [Polyangiaceae bacterium]|jgi:SAM-dependent methyltransferase
MRAASPSAAQADSAPSAELPRYSAGGHEIVAQFPSGASVEITRGRARAYPGLTSAAPRTLPLYELFAGELSARHVLDAGSGSGAGLRLLSERFSHVTGVDSDARALAFSKLYAPRAELVQADLCHGLPIDRADAALLVDVLGHVTQPEQALRNVRACLASSGRLLVAESASHPSQRLMPPARRAFSMLGLERLLLHSGFELETIHCQTGMFLAALARRSEDGACAALVEGFHLASRGRFEHSLHAFDKALASDRANVKIEALLGRAEARLALNDGDAAGADFFSVRELAPDDARALAGLARISLAVGAFDDALRLAADAVHVDPTDADAYAALALAAEQLGHSDTFDAWRIAANLAPDAPTIATGLARVATARERYDFAIIALERLRDYGDPHGADLHVTLSWLLSAEGRTQDAADEARFAEALAPRDPAVIELLQSLKTRG